LGVDPIPPKTCNWNCVYCQLGRTRPVVNARKEYVPAERVVAEIREVLDEREHGSIDWITFVGSGEPLLHERIGWMIREAKALTDVPVAVITNGSLLARADVREEVAVADAVLPSLDVGSPELYRHTNRPYPDCTFEGHVEGLARFREVYPGRLWVEVMLVRGVNDSDEVLRELAQHLQAIRPDEIHVNLPSRPAVEPHVHAPDAALVRRAIGILEAAAPVRMARHAGGSFQLDPNDPPVDAIAAIIMRHPMSESELIHTLARWSPDHVQETLAELERSGRVQVIVRDGTCYWTSAAAHFPDAPVLDVPS
jgi:wyosine [tRNA(Phe)-imidazoG37] synthetase (radical SAM superfamily)